MGIRSGARRVLDWVRGEPVGPLADAPDRRDGGSRRLDDAIGTEFAGMVPEWQYQTAADYCIAYLACETAKAVPIASLPVAVYRGYDGGSREVDRGPVAFELTNRLTQRWNPLCDCAEGLAWWIMAADTMGQAAVRVEWRDGVPRALWPLDGAVSHRIVDGRVWWAYGGDETTPAGTYADSEILLLRSVLPTGDWRVGRSVARAAAAAVRLSVKSDEFYFNLLKNQDHFTGYLETDDKIEPEDLAHMKQSMRITAGPDQAGSTRIFDQGLRYQQVDMSKRYVNLIDQQTWCLQQICRITRVPPSEVADLSRATYSNIEQDQLKFATRTLAPICHSLEVALTGVLRSCGIYDSKVKFSMDGLVRGDYKSRMEGYQVGVQTGIFTPNEVRAKEDMPPMPGGDRRLVPSSCYQLDEDGRPVPWPKDAGGDRTMAALDALKADMDGRISERVAETGDTPATREFAAKVLAPFARACLAADVAYDPETDIERLMGADHEA